MYKDQILNAISKILDLPQNQIHLEIPTHNSHGDYSTNLAMQNSGNQSPHDAAQQIVAKLNQDEDLQKIIKKIEVAGPGFINFYLNNDALINTLKQIDVDNNFGSSNTMQNKKIMVEFAHPNTHKELHIGHMRTLIVGESLSRILQFNGVEVFRANYQGDIGPHVAKAIWGTRQLLSQRNLTWDQAEEFDDNNKAHLLGEGYVLGNQEYEQNKQQIDDINQQIYDQDSAILPDYERTRRWSLKYYDTFYHRFNTNFDKLYFESQMAKPALDIINNNIGEVFELSEGAVIYNGEKHSLHKRVFITKAGYPTYEAKEMALAEQQYHDFAFDKNIHVVANEQAGYFKVVIKAIEELFPQLKNKEFHLSMGMVELIGKKISSRTGVVITVDSLLDEIKSSLQDYLISKDLSEEQKQDVLEKATLAAVKYSVLKVDPTANVKFDIKESVDLNGNSGPYLQYTYARTQSVLCKSLNAKHRPSNKYKNQNSNDENLSGFNHLDLENYFGFSISDLEFNPEEYSVLRHLSHFPGIIITAANIYSPSTICTYLFELAQKYNSFYNAHKINKSPFRLQLTSATAQVLKTGLNLLGIEAPEKM